MNGYYHGVYRCSCSCQPISQEAIDRLIVMLNEGVERAEAAARAAEESAQTLRDDFDALGLVERDGVICATRTEETEEEICV